ncbi:hypothetical protein B0H67DRAFT_588843 [Lasiosphaeris hirsuta]|uniref:Uncharacterized protein n=1 Tax=Lasiosphaeris hirsuta TaxID=260670 RepID=A0AA40DQ29_9PEZI|nr:hypothetical protein B0H67DRAFT_588843 [Lasiosphaeris hirsuta]
MRLEAWVAAACLAAAASAMGPASPGKPARPAGKPEKMKNWKWADPFTSSQIRQFDAACDAEQTFHAREFLLDDLSVAPPLGLSPFLDALKKVFSAREYPGSWDGIDPHGYDRNLLQMEYAEVPIKVREWIEEQERSEGEGRGLFAVYEKPLEGQTVSETVKVSESPVAAALRPLDKKKVVIFAPGALYEVLPLWVAEGSDCADSLLDVAKYSAKLVDGGVVAYPVRKTKARRGGQNRDMEFSIKAQVLKLKADAVEEVVEEEIVEASKTEEATKSEEATESEEAAKSEGKDEL